MQVRLDGQSSFPQTGIHAEAALALGILTTKGLLRMEEDSHGMKRDARLACVLTPLQTLPPAKAVSPSTSAALLQTAPARAFACPRH